jgi:hypothetical protein
LKQKFFAINKNLSIETDPYLINSDSYENRRIGCISVFQELLINFKLEKKNRIFNLGLSINDAADLGGWGINDFVMRALKL